jgi:oligoribonuclease NrnB/cAMP/cGMP phosphodiesterase (DHH superfamily)
MKCIFHNDLDGRAAAHVVAEEFKVVNLINQSEYGDSIFSKDDFFEINYGIDFPHKMIGRDETVFILDFSIPKEDMLKLLVKTDNVHWIDHHVTAIDKYEDIEDFEGIRDGTEVYSGCELTWMYLNIKNLQTEKLEDYYEDIPYYIRLIGDRDTWQWRYKDQTLNYFAGAELYEQDPMNKDWEYLKNTKKIIEEGKIVEHYKRNHYKEYLHDYAYEVEFEGYKANIVNVSKCDSKIFDSIENLHEMQIWYVFDGKKYRVSLRSVEDCDIDVGSIAQKYGGGGHRHASGFECDKLPWREIK